LLGEVPGPVGGDPVPLVLGHPVRSHPVHQLGRLAAAGEGDGVEVGSNQVQEQVGRIGQGRAAPVELLVDHRRVPHRHPLLAPGRGVVVDHLDRLATQRRRQLTGVSDGGRSEHEGRVGTVVTADAAQPTQHHRHVGAEDAAQCVHLVHHHELEAVEEVPPRPVIGEHPHVEHVWVGEDHVGLAADPGPLVGWGVAVVGGGLHVGDTQVGEAAQLVLGERLGGIEAQGGGPRLGQDGFDDGRLITQRLARSGARHHHRVDVIPQSPDRLRLVPVQPIDPPVLEPCCQERM
jgi:hypothetical protein